MFTKQQLLFIYAVSPLHMGAGTTVGVIDNPIQREVHTNWPSMAGSGIKGAIRHALKNHEGWKNGDLEAMFGPEPGTTNKLYAGAISFTDAQIVCFPVRSLRRSFVYTTCPTALARLQRLVHQNWKLENPGDETAWVADKALIQDNRLILEALAYNAKPHPEVSTIAQWLATNAIGDGYFAEKLKTDLVILSDADFTYFVRNSTLVEPHVRIDDTTGTAEGGGLFYTENLPPESLLVTLAMASQVRDEKNKVDAANVMEKISGALSNGQPVWQFGGDATIGRGLVMLRLVNTGGNE